MKKAKQFLEFITGKTARTRRTVRKWWMRLPIEEKWALVEENKITWDKNGITREQLHLMYLSVHK